MPKIRSDYLHLIITKYNVGLYGSRFKQADKRAWMLHRLPLFTNYCLPSILNQICQDFIWLVLFDERTPQRFLDELLPLLSKPNILCKFVAPGRDHQRIKSFMLEFVPGTIRFLVTQQLDNDDFLAADHVERIHAALEESRDLPYILDMELIYNVKEEIMKLQIMDLGQRDPKPDYATPFYIMVEKRQEALTCMHVGHNKVRQYISRYLIVNGLCSGRTVHEKNLAPKDRKSGTVITEDTISRLVEQFKINPKRITDLWRSLQS